MSVLRSGIIFLAVIYSAAISASPAYAITVLMISEIVKTGPLILVWGHFLRGIYVRLIGSWLLIRLEILRPHALLISYQIFEK